MTKYPRQAGAPTTPCSSGRPLAAKQTGSGLEATDVILQASLCTQEGRRADDVDRRLKVKPLSPPTAPALP